MQTEDFYKDYPDSLENYNTKNTFTDKIRYTKTLKLLPELSGEILDADSISEFTPLLKSRWPQIKNLSSIDFNRNYIWGKYDYILSFEVIEHLQNPLFYLEQCKSCLKSSGKLIFTTPIALILPIQQHFFELNKKRLIDLLLIAGLKPIRIEKIRKFGFGPIKFLKLIFGAWWYVEAIKI